MTNISFLIENLKWIAACSVCASAALAFAWARLGVSSRERALRGETMKLLHERKRLGLELVSARAEIGSLRQELAREGLQLRLALDALLESKSQAESAARAAAAVAAVPAMQAIAPSQADKAPRNDVSPTRAAGTAPARTPGVAPVQARVPAAARPARALPDAPAPAPAPARHAAAAPDTSALLAKVTAFLSTADLALVEDDAFEQPATPEARQGFHPEQSAPPARNGGQDAALAGPSKTARPAGNAGTALAATRLLSTVATSTWTSRAPEDAKGSARGGGKPLVA